MNQRQINNFQVYLFMIFGSGFYITLMAFRSIIKEFEQNAWYIPLIYIGVYLILIIPYKSLPKHINLLKEARKNKFINVVVIVYCFLAALLTIFYCGIAIKDFFFVMTPLWFFIGALTLCSLFLAHHNFTTIIQVGSIFLIFVGMLYLIPIVNNFTRPIDNILPLAFEYKKLLSGMILLLFPLDNFLLSFHNTHLKNGLTKKMLIINGIIVLLYASYILFDAISLVGFEYYKNLFFCTLFRWRVFSSNAVFENNDIIMLYILSVGVIFKTSLYFNTIRLSLYKQNKKINLLIMAIVFFIANYLLYKKLIVVRNFWRGVGYLLLGLIFIIYLYVIKQSRKVTMYEQTDI